MRRTAFMTRLEGGQFLYRDNLGGLCSICNEYSYEVFSEITKLIENHIENNVVKVRIIISKNAKYKFTQLIIIIYIERIS